MVLLRVIVVWMTALLPSLTLPPGASLAASPVAQCSIYAYDSTHIASLTADAAAERGPPALLDRHFGPDAVDLRFDGGSARSDTRSTTAYTHSKRFAQTGRDTTTTGTDRMLADGDSSSQEWFAVAANTVDNILPTPRVGSTRSS